MTPLENTVWEMATVLLYDREHDYNDRVTLYRALLEQLDLDAVSAFSQQQLSSDQVKAMQAQANIIRDALFSGRRHT